MNKKLSTELSEQAEHLFCLAENGIDASVREFAKVFAFKVCEWAVKAGRLEASQTEERGVKFDVRIGDDEPETGVRFDVEVER